MNLLLYYVSGQAVTWFLGFQEVRLFPEPDYTEQSNIHKIAIFKIIEGNSNSVLFRKNDVYSLGRFLKLKEDHVTNIVHKHHGTINKDNEPIFDTRQETEVCIKELIYFATGLELKRAAMAFEVHIGDSALLDFQIELMFSAGSSLLKDLLYPNLNP